MQAFKVVESYLHKSAKAVVDQWITELSDAAGTAEWIKIAPLHFRPGRWYQEYPVCADGAGVNPVWDEFDEFEGRCPTFEEVRAQGHAPKCVVDIGVIHKGALTDAIEIIHKNPTPEWKRALLARLDVNLIEVSALAVLRQIQRPERLPLWRPGSAGARR